MFGGAINAFGVDFKLENHPCIQQEQTIKLNFSGGVRLLVGWCGQGRSFLQVAPVAPLCRDHTGDQGDGGGEWHFDFLHRHTHVWWSWGIHWGAHFGFGIGRMVSGGILTTLSRQEGRVLAVWHSHFFFRETFNALLLIVTLVLNLGSAV